MADIKIIKPCKTAMSSGKAKTKKWEIQFNPSSRKYREYLMGWTGTRDTRYQMKLQFDTQAAAIAFANKHRFSYEVEEARFALLIPKSYDENFKSNRMKG